MLIASTVFAARPAVKPPRRFRSARLRPAEADRRLRSKPRLPLAMTSRFRLPVALLLLGALSACTGSDDKPSARSTPAASAGLGSRATAPATALAVRRVDQLIFLTPSKNIGCDLQAETVRCDIGRKSWPPPPKPADCPLDWGNGVHLDKTKVANFICAGDSLLGATSVVLAYGEAVQAGDFRCDSEVTALHCENEKTGHGFTLSVQDYDLF
jgi:uncharacterized protein DUF6636